MKSVHAITQSLHNFSSRHQRLQEKFDAFASDLATCFAPKNRQDISGITVSLVELNKLSVHFAGFNILVVFTTKVQNDVLVGSIDCFRSVQFPELTHHQVFAFTFSPNGDTSITLDDGDIVYLEGHSQFIVLNLIDKAVRLPFSKSA